MGPEKALDKLLQFISRVNTNQIPEQLKTLKVSLELASKNKRNLDFLLFRILAAKGITFPSSEVYFSYGFPKTDFVVYANLLNGRIGDSLDQLTRLLHVQQKRNLILFVRSRIIEGGSVIVAKKEFHEGVLPSIDYSSIRDYIYSEFSTIKFDRSILQSAPRALLGNIITSERESITSSTNTLVLHVRGGDALIEGTMRLPPLSYYKRCLEESGINAVTIVCEPDNLNKHSCLNPVPDRIINWCKKKGVEYKLQSSTNPLLDLRLLYNATHVIASASNFSRLIPLYGSKCIKLWTPSDEDGEDSNWMNDDCIEYRNCWDKFDSNKWSTDLRYRLAWVSGEI
ncbi:hypothetical protein PMIT1318_01626 [Prochlorococcus marinus str. MIT 1318]|uniref:hypothetical protein n=1 Tax=Prochlorococcus TaxID=1218 RepID=UPI0007BBF2EA|nr:hypothetical protein [Prochlorococcus marinus]KZR71818.1 hypothetical protein PMIT1318_01626 [Prochlorococcus marinus str. MIT 1318]